MTPDEDLGDQQLVQQISLITDEYGAMHRRAVRDLARDLARSRTELAHARRALDHVTQDLRVPLSTVLGFTALLLDDSELTTAQRTIVERVTHAAHTMTTFTEDLEEAVAVGGRPPRSGPVDASSVLGRVITRHQLLHPPRGVRIVLEAGPDGGVPTIVQGDEAGLEGLLDTLLSHAMEVSPENGVVRISVADDTREAEIRIHHDGPELPMGRLSEIVCSLDRAPDPATASAVGCRPMQMQVPESSGGRVHAETTPEAGTTFTVLLPLS